MLFIDRLIDAVDRLGQAHLPAGFFINRWVELAIVSALLTLLILIFLRFLGFCSRLRAARRTLLGLSHQMLLYRRHPRVVLRTQGKILWGNLWYLVLLIPLGLFSTLLIGLAYPTLQNRYGHGPATVGQDIVVRATASNGAAQDVPTFGLVDKTPGLSIAAQVRVPASGSLWARLLPQKAGEYRVGGELDGQPWRGWLNVGEVGKPSMPYRIAHGIDLYVDYPPGRWWGLTYGWIVFALGWGLLISWPIGRWLRIRL